MGNLAMKASNSLSVNPSRLPYSVTTSVTTPLGQSVRVQMGTSMFK